MPNARAIETPWMTAEECARYLRYVDGDGNPDLDRLYQARRRNGLPASHIGGSRALRFHKMFVDQWALNELAGANAHVAAARDTMRARIRPPQPARLRAIGRGRRDVR